PPLKPAVLSEDHDLAQTWRGHASNSQSRPSPTASDKKRALVAERDQRSTSLPTLHQPTGLFAMASDERWVPAPPAPQSLLMSSNQHRECSTGRPARGRSQ